MGSFHSPTPSICRGKVPFRSTREPGAPEVKLVFAVRSRRLRSTIALLLAGANVKKMCKLNVWPSLLLMSAVVVVVQSQITNLTLFEIYPCSNVTKQTVSRFKSDIYAIKPSFENCRNYSWWSEGQRFNKIVSSKNLQVLKSAYCCFAVCSL